MVTLLDAMLLRYKECVKSENALGNLKAAI